MIWLSAVTFVALVVVINSSVMAQNAIVGFHMPSQNIWCNYDARGTQALECDVIRRAWKDWAPRERVDGGQWGNDLKSNKLVLLLLSIVLTR